MLFKLGKSERDVGHMVFCESQGEGRKAVFAVFMQMPNVVLHGISTV